MRVALAILCVTAVTFLLRFLIALVKEGTRVPPRAVRVHLAKFNPSRQRRDLTVINLELQKRTFSRCAGERIAMVIFIAAAVVLPLHGRQTSGGPSANGTGASDAPAAILVRF